MSAHLAGLRGLRLFRGLGQPTPILTAVRAFSAPRSQHPPSAQTPVQSQSPPQGAAAGPVPHQPIQTPLQTQAPPNIMDAHQSPRAGDRRSNPGMPRGVWAIIIGFVVFFPPVFYWYYGYRKEHMDRKRAALIEKERAKAIANGRL